MGGPHIVNIQNPLAPVAAGGYSGQGYTHDAQIVIYNGPDTQHVGKEIFFGANEDKVVIVDVTNKSNPITLSVFTYPNTSYTHQGWLTPDQQHWIVGDEIDELDFGFNTRSVIMDIADLDNPTLGGQYIGATPAIDHNGYTLNDEFYLANYRAGVRLMKTNNIENGTMNEIGFFDTFPTSNSAEFNGAWSVYPYFPSGNFIVSDIDRGLFVLHKNAFLGVADYAKGTLRMSPNPAETNVSISSDENLETIEIYNILGKNVGSFSNINAKDYTFDVSNLSSGMYIVKINNKLHQKLIVR
jgi:choice-of-anchor B domain-containing protein